MIDAQTLTPAELNQLGLVIAERLAKQPLLVDSVDLAPLLSVSVETVKRYTAKGQIPCVRIGRRVLYQPEAVIDALAQASSNERGDADE
ncbi:helix-turn-helix domain-containing protein [Rosistilla oblonga]|uniref:helix-turn-helix domain-containing protein n=1 Tax=Rosistilla oblonga TaxID=2527990 RepID=UPI003A986866